jgi:hypothetical protein
MRPVRLLLAAPPDAPGALAAFDRVVARARSGDDAAVLLSGAGLAWGARRGEIASARAAGVAVSLCSRSARDRKVDPLALPDGVRWSSLTTFVSTAPDGADLWSAFP